jgi:hypothetical protein
MLSLDSRCSEFQMQIEKMHIDDNGDDMLAKLVTRGKLDVCHRLVGMTPGRQ